MNIFLDTSILAVAFFLNILISVIKPLIKISNKTYRTLLINAIMLILSGVFSFIYHKTGKSVNSLLVDVCLIAGASFIIYKIGYKEIANKVKEKL